MTKYRKECYKLFRKGGFINNKQLIKCMILNNSMFSEFDDIKSIDILSAFNNISTDSIQGIMIVTFNDGLPNGLSVVYSYNIYINKCLNHNKIKCNIGEAVSVYNMSNKLKKYL